MIRLKETGELVVITKVIYTDVQVVIHDKMLPVAMQYEIADANGERTDYVSPDQLIMS